MNFQESPPDKPHSLCNPEYAIWLYKRHAHESGCDCSSLNDDVLLHDMSLCAIQCSPAPDYVEGVSDPCDSGVYYQPLMALADVIALNPNVITETKLINESVKFRDINETIASLKELQDRLNMKVPCFSKPKIACPPPMCVTPVTITSSCGCKGTCCCKSW